MSKAQNGKTAQLERSAKRRPSSGKAEEAAGDVIRGNVGARARHVTIGKNITIIGNLSVPRAVLVWIVAALLAVVVVIGVVAVNTWPQPEIFQQMNGKFNLWIGKFAFRDAQGNFHENKLGDRLSEWMANTLHTKLNVGPAPNPSVPEFEVWQDATQPASNPKIGYLTSDVEAKTALAKLGADMVVFGYLDRENDPASLRLDFVYDRPDIGQEPDGDIGRQRLGGLIHIPADYQDRLSLDDPFYVRVQSVVWLARGLTKEFHGDYDGALAAFERLVDHPRGWDDGREVFYYFQGREAFQLRRLKEAESRFMLALVTAQSHGREYVTASLGLGNVFLERAQLRLLLDSGGGKDVAACQSLSSDQSPTELLKSIEAAQATGEISATPAEMVIDATNAQNYYQRAVTFSERGEWQPVHTIAQYLLANSLRTRADIYVFREDVSRAEADAKSAASQFEIVRPRFIDEKEYGFLAYTDYGLGLAHHTLSTINAGRGEFGQAHTELDNALTDLKQCQQYENQPDGDGDETWQKQIACYCRHWEQQFREEKRLLPADKGEKG